MFHMWQYIQCCCKIVFSEYWMLSTLPCSWISEICFRFLWSQHFWKPVTCHGCIIWLCYNTSCIDCPECTCNSFHIPHIDDKITWSSISRSPLRICFWNDIAWRSCSKSFTFFDVFSRLASLVSGRDDLAVLFLSLIWLWKKRYKHFNNFCKVFIAIIWFQLPFYFIIICKVIIYVE